MKKNYERECAELHERVEALQEAYEAVIAERNYMAKRLDEYEATGYAPEQVAEVAKLAEKYRLALCKLARKQSESKKEGVSV